MFVNVMSSMKFFIIFLGTVAVAGCAKDLDEIYEAKTFNKNASILPNGRYDNEVCDSQLAAFFLALAGSKFWAINVFDAWGKLPAGIIRGNLAELGSFDQCMEAYYDTTGNENVGIFKGQYCLASVDISELVSSAIQQNLNITSMIFPKNIDIISETRLPSSGIPPISQGICVPSACSPSYLQDALKNQIGVSLYQISQFMCQQKEDSVYTAWDITTICLTSMIVVFVIFSTIYDIIMKWQNKNPKLALIAFSMYTNGEKIFKCTKSKSENVLDCIHGIRSLSIIWIVFGHSYMIATMRPNVNMLDLMHWPEKFHSMLLLGAPIAVDSFFLLSGLLVTWSVLRELDRSSGRLNIFMMYFHRYIRLTPSLVFAVLFFVTFTDHVVEGPMRPYLDIANDDCKKWWWTTILYVQNYVNPENLCLGQSWYLSVDMQLFILSPLILYPLWRWRNKFICVILLLIILSMACVFTTVMINDFSVLMTDPANGRQEKIYFPTHTRCGAYLVGVLLGYLLHNIKGRTITIPMITVFAGWIISLGSIFTIIFSLYPLYQPTHTLLTLESAFYESFSRIGWAIALSWIVFACVHGYGGPINWFLSLPQWQPIGRLSYSIYIIHMPVIMLFFTSSKTSSYFSDANSIHTFWGDFGITLTVSIIWTMAFESPILTLEKLLLGNRKTQSKSNVNVNKNDKNVDQSGTFKQNV